MSLATNEVGNNQISSCLQPAKVHSLCGAWLAVATGQAGASPCCHQKGKDDLCAPLAVCPCPVGSVLWAPVLSVL